MVDWIYSIPSTRLALIVSAAFVGYYWAGCLLLRPVMRLFVGSRHGSTNDIVGYVLSCFGVFYGILLGLIAVAAYQNLSDVESNIASEAASLNALYEDVSTYPPPHNQNLQWLLRDYTRYVIKTCWPAYRQGTIPAGGQTRIEAFHERMLAFEPKTTTQEIVHAEAIRQFNVFLEHHRVREHSVTTGIPLVMWYVVIVGALLNISLVWLFDMKFLTHMLLGGLLAFFLASLIVLVLVLDHPFRGDVGVSPAAFETLYWDKMRDY